MKTATFNTQVKGRNYYGTITEKENDKFSISIMNRRSNMYSTNFQIEKIAKEIIAADFKHEAVIDLKDTATTTGLTQLLKENTVEMLAEYLEKMKVFAMEAFEQHQRQHARTEQIWRKLYDVIEYTQENKVGYYTRLDKMAKAKKIAERIVNEGLEVYTEMRLKEANEHYNESIIKLAARLASKGIVENSDIKVTSARVKQNFECYIYHDNTVTRAWTIIASGPIQKPHYRYLIK